MLSRRSLVGTLAGLVVIGLVVIVVGPRRLNQLGEIRPEGIALVVLATAAIGVLSAEKWRAAIEVTTLEAAPRTLELFRVVTAGRLVGQLFHQDVGAAVTQTAYLNRGRGVPAGTAALSVLLDRALDALALLALLPASALYATGVLDAAAAAGLAAASAAALVTAGALGERRLLGAVDAARAATSRGWRRLRSRSAGMEQGLATPAGRLAVGRIELALLLLLSLLRVVTVAARVWFVGFAVGADLSPTTALLLTPVAQLTLVVRLLSAGLGVYEAGWYGLLAARGVAANDALSIVVTHRLLTAVALIAIVAATEVVWQTLRRGQTRPRSALEPD